VLIADADDCVILKFLSIGPSMPDAAVAMAGYLALSIGSSPRPFSGAAAERSYNWARQQDL
jgi:hypothetical protein